MQASAYFWLRQQFERDRNEKWVIRTQPVLGTPHGIRKPDIVVYKGLTPYDFIELKCHLRDGFKPSGLAADLEKLRDLKPVHNVRHAYQFVLYDDEHTWQFNKLDGAWMHHYLTFVGANVRRHPTSDRQRNGYKDARARWERGNRRRMGQAADREDDE
jgi:hypothetical protein